MKPQPPVTKMRIAARTSSGHTGALADYSPVAAGLRDKIDNWKSALAESGWTPWLILGLATLLRFLLLGIKPPHFDEGINGWFVDQVVKNGFYRYDPTNYHGPLHFYVLLVSEKLFGRNPWALRLPVVLVSIASVWLAFKFEPLVGRTVSRLAALAMAVSPGFIFYGRYSIHEVWLQLFSMLFILGLLGLWRFGTTNYLWCLGMGVAGMILTKETYVIHIGSAVIAIPVLIIANGLAPFPGMRPVRRQWDYVDLAMVVAVGAAAVVFFYSGTFFHWSGVKGLYQAYTAWLSTGSEGHGHEKPWFYWLKTMAPSFEAGRADYFGYELPIMAGLLLSLLCLRLKNVSLRYLAIYGVGTMIVYSYVNYKTPWCVISFLWPFLFLFGGAVSLVPLRYDKATNIVLGVLLCAALGFGVWQWRTVNSNYTWSLSFIVGLAVLLLVLRYRQALYGLIAILLTASLGSAVWLNYFHYTTEGEPYVYVQTFNDINKLTKPLLTLAHRDPRAYYLTGHIIRGSAYPLPWILGDFVNIGYYEHENLPQSLDAPFLLVQEDKIKQIEAKLREAYYTDTLRIRAYQDNSKLYLNAKVFKNFFPGREPDFRGKPQS
jgi:uncharacterized protein (TIGR03663 family)